MINDHPFLPTDYGSINCTSCGLTESAHKPSGGSDDYPPRAAPATPYAEHGVHGPPGPPEEPEEVTGVAEPELCGDDPLSPYGPCVLLAGHDGHHAGASAQARSVAVSPYVDKAMFEAEEVEEQAMARPKVYLLSATPDPLGAVAAASMMYEGRVIRDLAEISDDERRHYFDQCFKTTLKAPLEFIDFHFMVEGVTRAHTHQEVRQRTAVFAQESMRFAVKEKIAARPGPLISEDRAARCVWEEAVDTIWEAYQTLIANGMPAEEARGLLPHDTLTRLHHKVNLRNLIDELGKRLCTQAQFEWRAWAAEVRRAMMEYGDDFDYMVIDKRFKPEDQRRHANSAWQFEYIANSALFQPICFGTGKCMFKAAMDRGCSIRTRVEEGRFDEIETREWAMDPTAGWVR